MRILHIDTETGWRGGENQLRLLLEGLPRVQAEQHVAVQPQSKAATKLQGKASLVLTRMRGSVDLKAAWMLARYCRVHQIDLIDAHTAKAHSLALLVKLFAPQLALVVHRRVDNPPGQNWLTRQKYQSPKVDRFIAISAAIADVLQEYGVVKERLRVVRSAVESPLVDKQSRAKAKLKLAETYGLSPKLSFIGNASALNPQKDYPTLLAAASDLKARGLPFHLFIAGDGELARALEGQRLALGLEYDVTFLGFIAEVPLFLSSLDILAVPSRNEGLGTIILEGICAGAAVAATRVGGIPEMIKHGETGLLSAAGDSKTLAEHLATLAGDAQLRDRLVAAARDLVAQQFSLQAMLQGNLNVYKEVLREKGLGKKDLRQKA